LIAQIVEVALVVFEIVRVFSGFGTVMDLLGRVAGALTGMIRGVLEFIAGVVNGLIGFLVKVAKKILFGSAERRAVKFLRQGRIEIPGADAGLIPPPPPPPGDEIQDELPSAADGASGALDNVAESAREVSEQLSNVATGFKINLRRFQATGEEGGQLLSPGVGGIAGGMTVFVQANDAEEIAAKLRQIESERASGSFRSNQAPGGSFQTSRGGS
jgi:hypothetical protein